MATQTFDPTPVTATVLYQDNVTTIADAIETGDDLWLTLPALHRAGGWELKPQGVCRDQICIPLPNGESSRYLRQEQGEQWFNLSAFARLIEQPLAHDSAHHAWSFGPPAWEWKARLTTRQAPDFTLADLQGRAYSLSSFHGKKVLLALWASW